LRNLFQIQSSNPKVGQSTSVFNDA